MLKIHLNSFGVILTTIGSFLIWRYLTELNWADKEAYLRGEGTLVIPSPTATDVKKFKLQLILSKLGLTLIIIGGIVQICSNYLPDN